MKKFKKIPTGNLGAVAYYLIQITQGIFKWNGELFFCPFVTLEDKKYPERVSTWTKVQLKDKKYSLPFIEKNMLWLFADPVDPETYVRTKQRSMDKSTGVDEKTIVYKKGSTLIIKNGSTVDTLEFVKKLSDEDRKSILGPDLDYELEIRKAIYETSKKGKSGYYYGLYRNQWVEQYKKYRSEA